MRRGREPAADRPDPGRLTTSGDQGPLEGRKAVIAFLVDAIITTNDSLWHSLSTPRIEVNDDTATGHWTVMVRMKHKGSEAVEILYGRYVDEFRRTPAGWRISSVRFIQELPLD